MATTKVKIEKLIKEDNLTEALAIIDEACQTENWVQKYPIDISIAKIYCTLLTR